MNPISEERKSQPPLQASKEPSTLDQSAPRTPGASTAEAAAPVVRPKSRRKRTIDETPKEVNKSEKVSPVRQKKVQNEQPIMAQDSTTPAVKSARARRTQKQMADHVTVQADTVTGPKRASNGKEAKEADVHIKAVGNANDMPPITESAIEYLGKKNATLADYVKLDPDSLTFVRYHLKRIHQLEADSRPTGQYANANTRPVSLALRRFADARAKDFERNHSIAGVQASADPLSTEDKARMSAVVQSYGQNVTKYSANPSVVVQLRKYDLATRKAGQNVEAGEVNPDDNQRMHRVLGTAKILMVAQISELTLADAAELAASDIKEVRAIQDASDRRLALSAMIESGLAQPLYHTEFAKQAPDLIEPATQAYRSNKADWGLAHEAIGSLSNFVGCEISLTKDETTALARRMIATIRAIEDAQYREQVLAASHQAALWHPHYRAEFANNAPDLVASAQVAYSAEESRPPAGLKILQADENSIEQSPLLLVSKAHSVHQNDQAAVAMHGPSSSEHIGKESTVSAASDLSTEPGAAGHPGPGRRLLLAIEDATSQASTWLSAWWKKSKDSTSILPVSSEKPTAKPVHAGDKSFAVPESVTRRFLKVESEYYFHDRTPAFSDRGSRLATRSAALEVVRSMLEIAKARGWDTITVKGTEEFRRSAWIEATQDGLTVAGYKPTALDLAELANRPASNTVEKGIARSRNTVPMQPQPGRPSAQTDNMQSASPHQATEIEPAPASLRVDPELVAKAKAFEEGKPAFVVRKYPDLASAYGVVAAAKAFASEKLPEASRDEFIEMARRHMTEKIAAGQQIQGPRIYLEPTKTVDARAPVKSATEAVDRERPPGPKAVNRER